MQFWNKGAAGSAFMKKFKNNSEKVLTNGYDRVILLPEAKPKCLTEEAMNQYVMIPNSLIQNRELGDKRVVVHNSIFFSGWSGDDIDELVLYAKYSLSRERGKVLDQFKELVSQLVQDGYYTRGMVYIKPKEGFGIIHYSEFQRIMQKREQERQRGNRINHAHLLLLLAHIRMCMFRQPGLPEVYSNLLKRISESTGLSVRSISSGLKILEELNIIHNEELPRYKDDAGHWHSNVRLFVNMELDGASDVIYNWQHELSRAIRYIMSLQVD